MTNKIFALFALSVFVFAFLVAGVSAVTLSTWDLTANLSGTSVGTVTDLTGTGVTGLVPTTNGVSAAGWSSATPISTEYLEVTLTGVDAVITSIKFNTLTDDADASMGFDINWSKDGFVTSTNILSTTTDNTAPNPSTISSLNVPLKSSEILTLRIFAYGASSILNDVFNVANLEILGDIVPSEVVECIVTETTDGAVGVVDTADIDLSVDDGFGEDEDTLYPFDKLSVESNIDYNGNTDDELNDIELAWGLFNRETGKWYIDDKEDVSDLEDGDDADVLVQFALDEDVDKFDGGDWVFYMIFTGVESVDLTGDEHDTCVYESLDVKVETEKALVLGNINAPEEVVQCSAEVLVTADIWNIGSKELKDNSIIVDSSALGINNQKIEVGDLKGFKSSDFDFTFTVPKNIEENSYNLFIELQDDDGNVFEVNNEETTYTIPIKVSGNCGSVSTGTATVSANLVSGGKAGQPLTVKATITNSGSKVANYTVNAAGFGSWASGATLSETTFLLNAGQSKDVTITLATKTGISGEQTFNVEVVSGNQLAMTQPVAVVLESAGFLSGITGGAVGGNGTIWLIGLVNVILVLAIIMVAVRFFRK